LQVWGGMATYSVELYKLLVHEHQRELWRVAELNRPTAAPSQAPQGGPATNHGARGRLLRTMGILIAAVMATVAVAQAAPPLGTPGLRAGAAQRPGYAPTRPVIYEPWQGWCTGRLGSCGFRGEEPR